MVCAVCNKESSNRRVCPFCFTPYPAEAPAGRRSQGVARATAGSGATWGAAEPLRAFVMRQSPVIRWSSLGIIVTLAIWAWTSGGSTPAIEAAPAAVPSTLQVTGMERDEALAHLKNARDNALVEMQENEVFVTWSANVWPAQPEGQRLLVQQFTRADEIVEGRRRRITFMSPDGRVFARADAVDGLTLVP